MLGVLTVILALFLLIVLVLVIAGVVSGLWIFILPALLDILFIALIIKGIKTLVKKRDKSE